MANPVARLSRDGAQEGSWFRRWRWRRAQDRFLKRYGFVCWCPTCHGVLNEPPCDWDYGRREHVYSWDCGTTSWWNFDYPTPLLSGSES